MANSIAVIPTKQGQLSWSRILSAWQEQMNYLHFQDLVSAFKLLHVTDKEHVDVDRALTFGTYYVDMSDLGIIEVSYDRNMKDIVEGHEEEYLIGSNVNNGLDDHQIKDFAAAWAELGYSIYVTPKVSDIRLAIGFIVALAKLINGLIELNHNLRDKIPTGIYQSDDFLLRFMTWGGK